MTIMLFIGITLSELITEMKESLELIIKWLKDSGLKVNDEKMEVCLFYRNDTPPITITFNSKAIVSKSTMNVLVVQFNSKLNWKFHVQTAIKKSIKSIRTKFTKLELLNIIKSKFCSTLYYNAKISLLPTLSTQNQKTINQCISCPS